MWRLIILFIMNRPDTEDLIDVSDLRPTLIEIFGLDTVHEYTFTVQIVWVGFAIVDKPLGKSNRHRGGVYRDDILANNGTTRMGVDIMALCSDAESDGGQRPAGLMASRIVGNQLHCVGLCGEGPAMW